MARPRATSPLTAAKPTVAPPLASGDRLTIPEFERRLTHPE